MNQKRNLLQKKMRNILSDEEAYGSKKSYAQQWIKTLDEIVSLITKISN